MADDDLRETERFLGCYAVLGDQVGWSFKALPVAIDIQFRDQPYTCQPGTFQPLRLNEAVVVRLNLALDIWKIQSLLIDFEASPRSDAEAVESLRKELNAVYDVFLQKFGFIHDNKHLFKFDGIHDSRLVVLSGLEVGEFHKKAEIFRNRVLPVKEIVSGQQFFDENLEHRLSLALNKCLDYRMGQIDVDFIAELAGVDSATAEDVLVQSGRILRVPITEGESSGQFTRVAPRRI